MLLSFGLVAAMHAARCVSLMQSFDLFAVRNIEIEPAVGGRFANQLLRNHAGKKAVRRDTR